ncbi:MAG: PilT/PilU family type 4a pilus ATPase [Verrucomicrobia bacterium]|jgi:twitching motility protein PilT|nr:PilT/PilU family type 4a pilus ATPase [Verrucomicrobiota bacterium]
MSETHDLFNSLLQLAVENGASDVHVKTSKPALLRLNGKLEPIDMEPVGINQILAFIEDSCPSQFQERWHTDNQVDYSYRLEQVGRFRINAFYQRGTPSMVFRLVKDMPPTFSDLNHEEETFVELCQQPDGILLLCGPTGCGKSSTLAAMLNWINHNQNKHVVSLEDPIEFTYSDIRSSFNQREVGIDTPTFTLGMTTILRQDPDIILIGEMRDSETFNTALSAAETGHYVFGTLHSSNAQQSVQRLFEFYPPDQHFGLRRQIAQSLRATVTQKLVPALEGGGRLPVVEIFMVDHLARNVISEGTFEKIPSVLEASRDSGSKSFNQDLYRLIKDGLISRQTGLAASPNPKALEMNLKGIFLSSGGIVE